jgi:hypothetical protein
MADRSLEQHTEQIVVNTLLDDDESELEHMMIGEALVVRDGSHYRIESGAESWDDLKAAGEHIQGRCDCGALLSFIDDQSHCRTCGRDYRSC